MGHEDVKINKNISYNKNKYKNSVDGDKYDKVLRVHLGSWKNSVADNLAKTLSVANLILLKKLLILKF